MSAMLKDPPQRLKLANRIDPDRRFETVNGVEMELPPMAANFARIASDLTVHVCSFGMRNRIGKAYCELKVLLPLERDLKRIPDMIFVPFSVWPAHLDAPSDDAWAILPDLCVEVISPTDLMRTYEDKLEEYFEAGVKQVWVVDPELKTVRVHSSRKHSSLFLRSETLTGGDILPGFELPLSELFLEAAPAGT